MVLLTPFSQGTHLHSVGRLIVVSDQAYHRCVVSEFDDDVGAVCGCTVMCVQGVNLIKLVFFTYLFNFTSGCRCWTIILYKN